MTLKALAGWPAAVVAIATTAAAVATIWRLARLSELLHGTRLFLRDWFGEEERPGFEARPSFPERMAGVEKRTAALNHDMRGEITSRLVLLSDGLDRVERHQDRNALSLQQLDARVTDHRRRNEEQIALLRASIDEIRRRGQQRRATDPPDPAAPQEPP